MALQAAGDARNRKSYTMGMVWQFNRLQLAFSAIWQKAVISQPGVLTSANDPLRNLWISKKVARSLLIFCLIN
jgi:hypothetical protein